jgi:membrane protein DedA with SNARE-associated domain
VFCGNIKIKVTVSRSLSPWLYSPLLNLGRFFSFLILYTVGRTPWTGDQLLARPLSTHRTTEAQNKRTHTFIARVGFEPTIPVFERVKTVRALDRAVKVIGK